MNNFIDWIKGMDVEMIVLLSLAVVIVIILIVILSKANSIYSAIAKKTLIVNEDLLLEDNKYTARISITNIGYINAFVNEVGFIYKDTKLPLVTKSINLNARESHIETIDIKTLREFIIGKDKRVSKFYVYTIDSLNRVTKKKMKLSYKLISKNIKAEIKEEKRLAKEEKDRINALRKEEKKKRKLEEKAKRFETGNYNFSDRLSLVLKAIGSPFVKFANWFNNGINNMLRKKEIKKEVKSEIKAKEEEEQKLQKAEEEELIRKKYGEKFKNKDSSDGSTLEDKKEDSLVIDDKDNDDSEDEIIDEDVEMDEEEKE